MFIIKNKVGQRIVKLLMSINLFTRYYAVLRWGDAIVVRRTKPVDELTNIKITTSNIFTLKFKYHSSHNLMAEYIAEIESHLYDTKKLLLNIWSSEQKEKLLKKDVLDLTDETNDKFNELLKTRVFKEKYGNNYEYFITLNLDPSIVTARSYDRRFSELTLKYVLKTIGKKYDMRLKSKLFITKDEASKLCSMISYWDYQILNESD